VNVENFDCILCCDTHEALQQCYKAPFCALEQALWSRMLLKKALDDARNHLLVTMM
jgi:hypothetical protein